MFESVKANLSYDLSYDKEIADGQSDWQSVVWSRQGSYYIKIISNDHSLTKQICKPRFLFCEGMEY